MLHHPIFLKENLCCPWITRFPLLVTFTLEYRKLCIFLTSRLKKRKENKKDRPTQTLPIFRPKGQTNLLFFRPNLLLFWDCYFPQTKLGKKKKKFVWKTFGQKSAVWFFCFVFGNESNELHTISIINAFLDSFLWGVHFGAKFLIFFLTTKKALQNELVA